MSQNWAEIRPHAATIGLLLALFWFELYTYAEINWTIVFLGITIQDKGRFGPAFGPLIILQEWKNIHCI